MFVVIRAFRDIDGVCATGSVVDPASLTRFKRAMRYGNIIEVTEQNFEKYYKYFKERYGVELSLEEKPTKRTKKAPKVAPVVEKIEVPDEPVAEAETTEEKVDAPVEDTSTQEVLEEAAPETDDKTEADENAVTSEADATETVPTEPEVAEAEIVEVKKVVVKAK